MLYVGTSGFAYDDWRGHWYPPDLARSRFFDYYAERFDAIEINSSYYQMPTSRAMDSLVRRAEGRLQFALKMHQDVTHRAVLDDEIVSQYMKGVEPVIRAGVLAAVLLQFPQKFHDDLENRNYLERIIASFPELPLVAEIRHESWRSAAAEKFLEETGIGLCLTDMPALKGLPAKSLTQIGKLAYLRFHGRNAKQWWHAEYAGGRYDYSYSEDELREWVGPVEEMLKKGVTALVFFNNHIHGQAPANAETFMGYFGKKLRTPRYEDLFSE